MIRQNIWSCFFALLFLGLELGAQDPIRLFEATFMGGTPVKHSSELTFDITQPSYGIRIAHHWQTTGKKEWQIRHHYPRIGLAAFWMQMGPKNILGGALSIAPELSFAFISKPRYELRSTFAYGLGILNRKFDYLDNPTNNAISAHINISVQLKFDQSFRLSPHWFLTQGIAMNHFSNGARHLPNFGINIANFQLGLQYRNMEFDRGQWTKELPPRPEQSPWALDVQTGLGYREREESRGPAYPIFNLSAALAYHINPIQKMSLGFSWEKNRGVYVFGRHILLFNSAEEAAQKSQRRMIFYAHEFRFGPMGVNVWLGTYLAKQKTGLLPGDVFNVIEIRYYLPRLAKLPLHAYLAFDMKSHRTRAEYVSLRFGTLLGNYSK